MNLVHPNSATFLDSLQKWSLTRYWDYNECGFVGSFIRKKEQEEKKEEEENTTFYNKL